MVCDSVQGRRREEEEKEKEPGIQNQKQEPHTKLWGIILAVEKGK
jgi:hypothetical protein